MNERDLLIEAIASKIEGMGGNYLYQRAWRKAARMVRKMLTEKPHSLTDKSAQIGSTSPCR